MRAQPAVESPAITIGSPAWRYITPFAAFLVLLAAADHIGIPPRIELPLRFGVLVIICAICWPREIPLRLRAPLLSIGIGILVFALWVAPDFLIPGYRNTILFSNSIIGHVRSSLSDAALSSGWVLFWRTARAVIIVPVVEELFWRGWMMRWIIHRDFTSVPIGAFTPAAFWITAILFASEHGPYWDVGLLAGVAYNWWALRTKSLSDCMLSHAVTNGVLSWFVIAAKQWQYWQ